MENQTDTVYFGRSYFLVYFENAGVTFGDDDVDKIFAHFPDVKDSVYFCSYWFRLTQDNLTKTGRAGLVGTNLSVKG